MKEGKPMTIRIIIVLILTLIIYIISALAYSVRVVAVKTGRIAISFALFNVFALISRTANSIQSPLLGKTIDISNASGTSGQMLLIFRYILLSSTIGTIIGAILMPTFIKVFQKLVESFNVYRSVPKLLLHGFSKAGIEQFKMRITKPKKENLSHLKNFKNMPKKVLLFNIIACSITTVGNLSSLYACCLNPGLEVTCSYLSAVINGIAVILMYTIIDPYVSMLTDDVIRGEYSELQFSRCIIFIVSGLIIGTVLAQFLLVPAAEIIGFVARLI